MGDLRQELDHLVCGGLDLADQGVLLLVVFSAAWVA
jgi:hypothetical protein